MAAIGESLAPVKLRDLNGALHSLFGPAYVQVILFWSAECPVVRLIEPRIAELKQSWPEQVGLMYLASNVGEPRELLIAAAKAHAVDPVLLDEQARMAAMLEVTTTPEAVVIDGRGRLRYRGAVDDSTMRHREPSRHYLAQAVHAVLAGVDPDPAETAGYGCAIVMPFGDNVPRGWSSLR
jgi:thiol-disulfide isomerase/thioredoxin